MNWALIFSNALYTAHRRQRHRRTACSPSALTCTSATPACSTSARPASPPSAPTASPSRSPSYGWKLCGRASRSCSSVAIVFAPAARHPDAAAARRLPGHRHHRRRRDPPAVPQLASGSRGSPAATTACSGSPSDFERPQPVRRASASRSWAQTVRRLRPVHDARRLDRSSLIVVGRSCGLLDAQPVGPGAEEHPRGRGRGPQPRQERLRLQDAEPGASAASSARSAALVLAVGRRSRPSPATSARR